MDNKRRTVQRQLTLNVMKELNIHATAEQVYARVHQTHPTISRATVYRNLRQMAEAGELLDIGSLEGATHYDHNCHPHHHFLCAGCKRIIDVEGDISDLYERFHSAEDIEVTGCNITLGGMCRVCKERSFAS